MVSHSYITITVGGKTMKRILPVVLVLTVVCASLIFSQVSVSAGSTIESAISWAIAIANDNSHLYSQSVRWGPSYDCSSFVISAFRAAGVDTGSASWTGNMKEQFTQHGFAWIDWSQIGSVSNLQRGDVLLYHDNSNTSTAHTEIYIGNNTNVGAHSAKRPAADQISVSGYYWHPWHGVLRYVGDNGYNPTGYADSIVGGNGTVYVRGWAFDRDDVNAEILLHVYVDGNHYATIKADKSRPDINNAYPGVGNNHGFEEVLVVNKSGNLNIKVFAINVGNGSNVLIQNGEKNVSVTADPKTPKKMKECTLDGHTYKLYACSTTWENAKTICESKGGYLATITSGREQTALYKLISEYSPSNFYLGGTSTSGSWKWVTGEPFSYTAWPEGQPDCAGNNEFYLGAYKHSSTNGNLKFWNDFTNNYSGITGFVFESGDLEENKAEPSDNPPTVSYSGYIKDSWTENSANGETIGTENKNRFKAIKVELNNCSGGIKYAAHFANAGWCDYVQDGKICGSTTNDMSSIEAIKMELYGDIANSYNVFYRAYIRDKGWLEWAKNGELAGSTDGSLPITAIKVMLVPQVRYASHIQDKGWTDRVKDREISGTVGEELRLEALQIYLKDTSYGNIRYKTHLEDLGWGSSVYNGKESGTTGLGLRAESLTVALDGKANDLFDVMYKVHQKDKGWTDWVRNGASAGTTGEKLRMEAFKVMVVPKGYTGAVTFKEYTSEHFTVTFDPMGGECNVKTKPISYCGFFMDLPTPQKTGYVFAGWYDSKDYNNLITSSSTLETKTNITLYAKWIKYLLGDVDGDGEVNPLDVTLIQRHNASMADIDEAAFMRADVDGNGTLDILDATWIQRHLAHIDTSFAIGESIS